MICSTDSDAVQFAVRIPSRFGVVQKHFYCFQKKKMMGCFQCSAVQTLIEDLQLAREWLVVRAARVCRQLLGPPPLQVLHLLCRPPRYSPHGQSMPQPTTPAGGKRVFIGLATCTSGKAATHPCKFFSSVSLYSSTVWQCAPLVVLLVCVCVCVCVCAVRRWSSMLP